MLKAAIVGIGGWGRTMVEAVQGKSEKVRFVAGMTRTPACAQAFARRHGLVLHDEFDAVLEDPAIEAVILATPDSQHASQALAAVAANKHVLVEKPFTLSLESAERGVQAARARGVVLAVAHNRRFLPAIARLRELLAGEVLGTVLHVEANQSGPDGFDYPADGWRADPAESPAGGMTAMGIHMVDTMIGLLGRVASVRAQSFRRVLPIARDDTTSVLLRFANGASGYLGTTEATAANSRLQIFGSAGWAELREERHLRLSIIGRAPENAVFPAVDITRAELEAFADAIAGRGLYPLSAAEAVHGVAVLEAIVKSARSDERVDVADGRLDASEPLDRHGR